MKRSSRTPNDMSRTISSPVPFWFLNGPIEEWHIVRQFEMMREKGISEVVVHPRYGLEVEYLSDAWFEVFGWCVREAKKRGMRLWIYDEFNWPSGTAGMSVMKLDPNYHSKYLSVETVRLDEINVNSFQPGLCMIAANIEGGSVTKTKSVDGINGLIGLTGDWLIFNCTLTHDPYYIDTLSWDAVNCFKRLTYDEYAKRFGDEFGNTITAVFTDEPSIYWVSVGHDDWNLPYTDDYFQTFRARYGYECELMIPYLFFPGRESARVRADFWEHAGFLFNERYHANLSQWCREHCLLYTGHNVYEEPLRYQIRFQGDMFGTMRLMDVPGVDHLGKQTLGNPCIGIVGHKICSSAAHITKRPRCVSESFGVMGWDTTYADLKRVADWQYALGINMLVPHAIYHTISGMTKRECPPSFFYQSPHWDDFGYFGEYVMRIEEMLTGGRHVCKVAIMYPSSGLWASYQTDRKTTDFEHTDNFLGSLCLELVRSQIDFDIVDFKALADAQLENEKIKIAGEEYEVLLVPSTPYLRSKEVKRLTEIVLAGVRTTFFHKSMEPIEENLPSAMRGANFVRTSELPAFADILRRQVEHDIQITGGGAADIMAYRREKDGRKITFLLNRSEKHRKVSAMLKDYPDPAIYDQETGEYTAIEGRRVGKKLLAQLRFQPNQSFFIVSGVSDAPAPQSSEAGPVSIEVRNLSVEVPFNVASIYHFRFTPTPETSHPLPDSRDLDVRTEPRYIPVNWSPETPDWTQWAGAYEADIEVNAPTEGIRLVLDRDFADCEVYVNGQQVQLSSCCSAHFSLSTLHSQRPFLTDFFDVAADIGHLIKPGTNRFKVVSPTKLSEPVRLVGQFSVSRSDGKIAVGETGNCHMFQLEEHYPFFSGTVKYQAEFDLSSEFASLILDLRDARDSAEVWVNGKRAGKRLWPPYTFEIAPFARPGRNELRIDVRNNLTNLILGEARPFGLRGVPAISGYQ